MGILTGQEILKTNNYIIMRFENIPNTMGSSIIMFIRIQEYIISNSILTLILDSLSHFEKYFQILLTV